MNRRMKKVFLIGVLILFMGTFPGVQQKASALEWDLNTIICGPTLYPYSSFGTIELTDLHNGNVGIEVSLNDSDWKIHSVYLNYNGINLLPIPILDTDSELGVVTDKNGLQADGYNVGYFDYCIPDSPPGSINELGSYEDEIFAIVGDIDAADFMATDTSGMLYAAVHIGNFVDENGLPCELEDDSIWVGVGPSVPEPATVLLLGTGVVGLWVFRRKSKP